MSNCTLQHKQVKTRKQHYCCWCGDTILKNNKAIYRVYILDSEFKSDYMHPECNDYFEQICSKYPQDYADGWLFGENERPKSSITV